MACAVMVVMAFIFQVRSRTVEPCQRKDISFTETGIAVAFYIRKGKSLRRPLILSYPINVDRGETAGPIALIRFWFDVQPSPGTGFPSSLQTSLQRCLTTGSKPPDYCYFSAHSLRIGGYKELSVVGFSKEFIMRRLDWETDAILLIYMDSRIVLTGDSSWFFAHMRSLVSPPL